MPKLNNIKPSEAAKFLIDNGWELYNRKSSHETYVKNVSGKDYFCQVIYNEKTIFWKNAKIMIKKSMISEKEWIKKFSKSHT